MPTLYPAQIDTPNSLLIAVDNQTILNSAYFNSIRSAIIAIEQSLGTNPGGSAGTVGNRLIALENNFSNLVVIQLAGDLGGTVSIPLVIGLQGNPVSNALPTTGQVLTWNGVAWVPAAGGGGGGGSFTAGGDLAGSATLQQVVGIRNVPVSSTPPTTNQVLGYNGTQWIPVNQSGGGGFTAGGDLSGSSSNQNVINIHGASVPIAGGLITGNVLQVNGLSSLVYGAVNLAGGATHVTGVLPVGNQAAQTMGVDVTGTTGAATVVAIQGHSIKSQVLGAAQDGYSLTWVNADSKWEASITQTSLVGPAGGQLSGTFPNPTVDISNSATAYQVTHLHAVFPKYADEVIFVDGYSAANDGGPTASAGSFYWNSAYSGPSNPLNVVPDGYATGAWTRVIGTDNTILATWFGAKGDMNLQGILETDDTLAIQAMLDMNNGNFGGLLSGQSDANNRKFVCKLPATAFQYHSNLTASRTTYRITQPLQISDTFINYFGNTTNQFIGEPGANSGLYYWEFLGPSVVCGNYGFNQPAYVLDPNGSGETLVLFGPISGFPVAKIAAGSDGQTLPQSTINVDSTAGYTTAGQIAIGDAGYVNLVAYTGITSTSFTGCTVVNTFGSPLQTMHTGDTVGMPSFPQWNFNEFDVGDLSGFTSFCFEFFINPCNSTAWLNLPAQTNYIGSMFGCGGTIGSLLNHTTFSLIQTNENTNNQLIFGLTTVNGSFQVNTSTSVDHAWTANTLNHIAISYDGAHLRMFVNGAQPDASMTIAATGALDQRWYESITLCSGGNVQWPVFGGGGTFQPGPCMLLGKIRFSNIARYTAPFTAPLPSAVTCDTNSRLYMDFNPRSIPTRGGLRGFNIAQCGEGPHGSVVDGYGFPVWLRNFANGVTYTGFNQIRSMFFHGPGTGIYASASTNSEFGEDCFFLQGEQGIVLDNFSYNSGIGKGVTFWQMGAPGNAHCLSAEIVFGHGMQFGYVLDGMQSEGQSNWCIVGMNADVRIGTCFPNGFKQGTFAFVQNASTTFMSGTTVLDDQTAGFGLCGVLFAPSGGPGQASLIWDGGYIGMEQTHSAPVFLIGEAGIPVDINTTIFASGIPIFSFQGGAATTTTPAIWRGGNAFGMPVIDVNHPGPVLMPGHNGPFDVRTWGAVGDGVTDDSNAIQNCINAMYHSTSPTGTLYFGATSVTAKTSYLITRPIFLGGQTFKVEMDSNTEILQSLHLHGPVFVSSAPFPAPTYGTENGLTYVELKPGQVSYYNLAYTPINNIKNWGDGYAAYTTASFVTPSQLNTVLVQVNSTAGFTMTNVYMQGVGKFTVQSIPDSTHLLLANSSEFLPTDVMTNAGGQVIPAGTGISACSTSGYTGPTPGFTFEAFIDPITDFVNGQVGVLLSSGGAYGSNNPTYAVQVYLYNDQVSAQTRVRFALNTSGSVTTLNSGTHTLTAGTLKHIACTYDGYSTMNLYVDGVLAATSPKIGIVSQGWYELMLLGLQNYNGGYPGVAGVADISQTVKIAGLGFFPIAKYSGASFTPPTTVPTYILGLGCSIIDFANHQTVIGPNGQDYGTGWMQATCPNVTQAPSFMPCWLQTGQAGGLDYNGMPLMTNVNVTAHSGDCFYSWSSLDGILNNCYFIGGQRGITLDGFSYRNRVSNCSLVQGFLGLDNTGMNQYSWNFGQLNGSQYAFVDGGYMQGGAWNIVTNVYAGIHFQDLWCETTGMGGMLLNSQGGPAATVHDVFFQSDTGSTIGAVPVATIYAFGVQNLTIEGGFIGASMITTAPQLTVDSCANVMVNGSWMTPATEDGYTWTPLVTMINQTFPVVINTPQAFAPFLIAGTYTTYHVINGSNLVAASSLTVIATVGNYVQFSSQPNTTYIMTVVNRSSGQLTLNVPYSGTTTSAAIATQRGFPWMPEDGYAGQGPLLLNSQETFGIQTVNMISSTGMTLLMFDFLWGTLKFTDADGLLGGTVMVTLPLIAGYRRAIINATGHTLTFGGITGGTVNIANGVSSTIVCDGTNWIASS